MLDIVAAGCLGFASKMIPQGVQNMHIVGCIWDMRCPTNQLELAEYSFHGLHDAVAKLSL
jgi:hypothetical protein